ncbi:MAG: DUF1800 domain-containing protein [Prolixibacteraceae bacterium]|nr:DUF1800 domain-containing protein [Prolixibacteraceae bacterium]
MGSTGKSYSLQPISGNLDYTQARHLLDRCTFGPKKSEVDALVGKSISTALTALTQIPVTPAPPVSYDAGDLDVALGTTWINAVYNSTYNAFRLRSLRSWWIGLMMQQGISLVEKMTLFWHNHFVTETEVVTYSTLLYQYNQLLRKYALGNIKQLVYDMTINPAMLIYLNGESNKASAPNENYGRELFELFTIGKGPLIADGNYTNYTETDIREAAKVLTGWKVNKTTYVSYYDTTRHDKTTKVFTEAFGKTSIQNKEAEEYKLLVDMIFNKMETARYITRKVYRWLMYYTIDQTIETQIIEPLATTLFNNNYEIKPMLEQLLSSEHFFSSDYFGSQIKNPIDFTIGVYNKCEISLSPNVLANYEARNELFYSCRNMEMALGDPPDVAGWPQYYKEPSYYELWVNSATVPIRTSYTDTFCASGITKGGYKYVIDPFVITSRVSDATDATKLINGFAQILLPIALSNAQLLQLKEVLIPGLPDSTWTFEWNKYISNPSDATQKSLISKKLMALLKAIFRMPEFYLA